MSKQPPIKYRYAPGIYDRRVTGKGKPTSYKGDLPYRWISNHRNKEWRKSGCCPELQEAKDAKADWEWQYRNRKNLGAMRQYAANKLEDITVEQVIEAALKYAVGEIRGIRADDHHSIKAMLKHPFFPKHISLFGIHENDQHFRNYFNERLHNFTFPNNSDGPRLARVTAGTVAYELRLIRAVFRHAIDNNWFDVCRHLKSSGKTHLTLITAPRLVGAIYKKDRSLLPDERQNLVEHFHECQGLNKYYLPLAIYLALDTAMREQEVVNLLWSDINFETRRITIRKTKTDWKREEKGRKGGRIVVLPYSSMQALLELYHHLTKKGHLPGNLPVPNLKAPDKDTPIFIDRYGKQMTPNALAQAFRELVSRCPGIIKRDKNNETLTFHCLRRAANRFLRLIKADPDERAAIRDGHAHEMDGAYGGDEYEDVLKTVQDKLDKHMLKVHLLDSQGRRVTDFDGNYVTEGVTLDRLIRMCNGRKMPVSEMLEKGYIPIPYFTRPTKQLEVIKKQVVEQSDIVFRCDRDDEGKIIAYEHVGLLNLVMAI